MTQASANPTVEQRWRVELPRRRPGKFTDQRLGLVFEEGVSIVRNKPDAERCRLCGYKVTKLESAVIGALRDAEAAVQSAGEAVRGADAAEEPKPPKKRKAQ